jgi:hypothetical protein
MRCPAATRASIPGSLEEVAEIHAITEILHEYCEAVDEQRVDDVVACFTPECRFDRGFGMVFTDRRALRDFLAGSLARYSASNHALTNIRVRLTGEGTASASSYVMAYHWYTGTAFTSGLWARYRDILVKRDGRWMISARWIRSAGELRMHTDGRPSAFEPMDRRPPVPRP